MWSKKYKKVNTKWQLNDNPRLVYVIRLSYSLFCWINTIWSAQFQRWLKTARLLLIRNTLKDLRYIFMQN